MNRILSISTAATTSALTAALLAAAGCNADRAVGGMFGGGERRVQPHDFVAGPSTSLAEAPDVESASASAPPEDAAVGDPYTADLETPPAVASVGGAEPFVRIDPDEPLPVDGMIGQINGRPVFADDVLADLDGTLRAKGRQLSRAAFEREARTAIAQAVQAALQSRLILAEAERSLTENEWNGVRYMREQHRNELLRKHGMGSLKAADRTLREDTGRGLEETLVRFQEAVITRTYVNRNLNALINVTRRDIERFYRDNLDRFQPEPWRDLTIIVTDTQEDADAVRAQLDAGTPFSELAAGPLNQLMGGGTMARLKGDEPFGRPEIETPMVAAEQGDWFGPVQVQDGRFWFVKIDGIERGPQLSLEDAQASIEASLRQQQQSLRTQQFIRRLREEGNFTDQATMIDALTKIAVSRYAPQAAARR